MGLKSFRECIMFLPVYVNTHLHFPNGGLLYQQECKSLAYIIIAFISSNTEKKNHWICFIENYNFYVLLSQLKESMRNYNPLDFENDIKKLVLACWFLCQIYKLLFTPLEIIHIFQIS